MVFIKLNSFSSDCIENIASTDILADSDIVGALRAWELANETDGDDDGDSDKPNRDGEFGYIQE